jgi:hypothetical protein
MRCPVHASIALVLLAAGLLLLSTVPAVAGRGEAVLSWDDGTAEGSTSGLVGQRMAVRFQAPPGNCGLMGMRMYSVDDGVENPVDPQLPSTMPFTVWVWRVGTEDEPGIPHASYVPFMDLYAYPEDAWVEAMSLEPVDLSDPAHFPDGWFFIGIELEYRDSPYVGLDLDPPISGESWFHDWSEWVPSDTANLMIRAVVCDSTGSPVELESWGTVKQQYR